MALKIKFGVSNPNIPVAEYSAKSKDITDSLINTPFGTTIVPSTTSAKPLRRTDTSAAPTVPITYIVNPTTGVASDFAFAVEKNSLYIEYTKESKQICLKLVEKRGVKHLVFSNSTNENKFRTFNCTTAGIKTLNIKTVMKELKLDDPANKYVKVELFGTSNTISDRCDYIARKFSLTYETGKSFTEEGKLIVGYGICSAIQEEVPKLIHFGKNILFLNKLYHKNILSIKNKKMHAVEHFPNVKLSDKLLEIICNIYHNKKPTKEDLDLLKTSERQLFDLLLYVSELCKKFLTKKDVNINELKERLKLGAGNNTPIVKNELKGIVQKLQLYNLISMNNAKNYLKRL